MTLLLWVLLLLAAAYQLTAWLLTERFARRELPRPGRGSPVAISQLKPIRGVEPRTRECLASFLEQDYDGPFEVVFTAGRSGDPAVELARELQGPVSIVVGSRAPGANRKVAGLAAGLEHCRYDLLVVSDADMRAPRDYLARLAGAFSDPEVGMATCLYGVRQAEDPGQALEGLAVTDFATSVLVARAVEGISFGLGATMAFRREALEAIGGFAPVLNHLADDYQLGHRVSRQGWKVVLAPVVLEDVVPPSSLVETFRHQLRWMRTYRVSRPGGHLAYVVSQGLPWALGLCLAQPAAGSLALACWTVLRAGLAWRNWTLLGGEGVLRWLWLTPFKDALYLALWLLSFTGREVSWGGEAFRLRSDGTMVPVKASSASPASS